MVSTEPALPARDPRAEADLRALGLWYRLLALGLALVAVVGVPVLLLVGRIATGLFGAGELPLGWFVAAGVLGLAGAGGLFAAGHHLDALRSPARLGAVALLTLLAILVPFAVVEHPHARGLFLGAAHLVLVAVQVRVLLGARWRRVCEPSYRARHLGLGVRPARLTASPWLWLLPACLVAAELVGALLPTHR
ncbi:MAG: hypothetical protein IT373_18880 [Polyangiaceae bacterium]|nr:hypothetical protein [Polyangiaceae bacterium]